MIEKRNVFLVGPMGSGKSTIGKKLAKFLFMDFYDSDHEIEKRTGANIEWVFDVEGESGFRKREEKIILELTQKQGIILATGGGSVISSISRKYLQSRGLVIYLKTSIEQQLCRTKLDKKRPLLEFGKIEKNRKVLKKLSIQRNFFYEKISDFTVSTDNYTTKKIVSLILGFLSFR